MDVKIFTHDGRELEAFIENFDLDTFILNVNTKQHEMMKFGNYGVIKSSIKFVDANYTMVEIAGEETA